MRSINKIIQRSCEDLSELDENSVALTITSPPYWNAIDYDIHSQNSKRFYRTRAYAEGYENYEDYLDWLNRIFTGIFQKTKPGGFCCIVIGTVLLNRRHYPVPFDLVSRLTQKGPWDFHQEIVWYKVTGGVKRAGVFIQKPYPGYYYPNIMTEYILIFRKNGPPIFENRDDLAKKKSQLPIDRLFKNELANTVWHIAPVPPNHLDHPCPFPEEIPLRLIQFFSYEKDLVLDPFCGSGQTLKVANHLSRQYVGFETVQKYVDYARKRIQEPLSLRENQLLAVFEKIPTVFSPKKRKLRML